MSSVPTVTRLCSRFALGLVNRPKIRYLSGDGILRTSPALFIGPFESIKQFQNTKFRIREPTNIHDNFPCSSYSTTAAYIAFKQALKNNQPAYY